MKDLILRRMREPSTWLGLALVAGVALPPGGAELIATAVGGLLAVVLPEGKS